MSLYAGQFGLNRPFNRNTYYGAKTDNYQAHNEYISAYEAAYGQGSASTGENSYNYCSGEVDQTFQETAGYGNEFHDTQYEYQANAEFTEDYSAEYYTDNNADYTADYSAEYSTDYNAEYTEEGYGNTTNYDYGYEQQSAEGYGYEQDSYAGQTAPVTDYHNYTSGGSSRGAPSSAAQFGNRRGNYQAQNRFGITGPAANFSGRGRGRGRGQFNQNAGRKPPRQQWQPQGYGQFGKVRDSEKGQFDTSRDNEGRGQFNLPSKNTGSTNIVTQSAVKKTNEGGKEGQFGLPKETTEPPSSTETSAPTSDRSQQSAQKQESNEEKKEQSEVKDESKEVPTEKPNDEEENDDEDSDSSDEDTGFCKYCKLNFSTPKAYHTHTRGLQHTTLVMEAKAKKGDVRFQKEEVDASVLEVHIPEPKAPSPEKEDEDEVETNWMNLDDDVMKYIKQNRPENRDLNPNDVGKNPLPDDFTCPLCNIKCTGAGAFKMHIDGKQHKNNIEAAKQGAKIKKKKIASSGVMVETKDRPSKFSEMAKDSQVALLGLEFVTEFQKTDFKLPPRYVCNLCESKCDGSTIIPHVIGLKHRLKYMQIKRPLMYDHLTKFNSKRKKSEMNANLEDFANEIEAEVGRGDVKIKVELENFEDEDELKETMMRHSKALAVKVKEMEEGKIDSFNDETTSRSKSKEPPSKKPRMAVELATEWRSRPRHEDHFSDRWGPNDRARPDDLKRPSHDKYDRPGPDDLRRPPHEKYDRLGSDNLRRPPYDEPRRPPYDDPRDPYYRRRYPEDFKASYRDRFDPYRRDDPMYERRMFDERRRLDGLMGERYRLDDPFAERRRVDDIVERRRYLDELERSRVADILERRKRLQEEDVDYLRLQRFMGRESTVASSSPSLSVEEKTRLDSQLARREALAASTAQSKQETDVRAHREELPARSNPNQETDVKAIQNKLAAHKSTDPNMAAQQEKAAKALQEEAAKNPNVNIGEIMANLSTSMIATEDDAAMALQISNALTQALLKYRIQNAPRELASITKSIEPMFEQKPVEPSIPGLGASCTTSSSVPSFLRTSQHSVQSSILPTADSNSSYLQTSVQGTLGLSIPQSSGNPSYLYTQQQSVPSYVGQQYSYTGSTQATGSTLYPSFSQKQPTAAPAVAQVSRDFGGVTSGITNHTGTAVVPGTLPSGAAAPPHVLTAGQGQKKPAIDTSNVDQPQKLLLESIRKQTELLKQKIQASVGIDSRTVDTSVTAQSQPKHVPSSTHAASSASLYTSYASSTTSQVHSAAGYVTSQANKTAASQHNSQYHQYNYHTAPLNAAAQGFVPVQPPLPSQPPPAPPLPTNDLPPIRRKKRN
ncbi:uncharacterized protein LOC123532981 [Mercenaria mercenaria]|uniref:uncharacterized protein LOC123532981 n=1 Tax=Mercenaria mercenaria TaxID=6596 RepID=UPI00234EF3F6|nr:uncharacterized protein LOC123532981 [Mercenaria mercenaria]